MLNRLYITIIVFRKKVASIFTTLWDKQNVHPYRSFPKV